MILARFIFHSKGLKYKIYIKPVLPKIKEIGIYAKGMSSQIASFEDMYNIF